MAPSPAVVAKLHCFATWTLPSRTCKSCGTWRDGSIQVAEKKANSRRRSQSKWVDCVYCKIRKRFKVKLSALSSYTGMEDMRKILYDTADEVIRECVRAAAQHQEHRIKHETSLEVDEWLEQEIDDTITMLAAPKAPMSKSRKRAAQQETRLKPQKRQRLQTLDETAKLRPSWSYVPPEPASSQPSSPNTAEPSRVATIPPQTIGDDNAELNTLGDSDIPVGVQEASRPAEEHITSHAPTIRDHDVPHQPRPARPFGDNPSTLLMRDSETVGVQDFEDPAEPYEVSDKVGTECTHSTTTTETLNVEPYPQVCHTCGSTRYREDFLLDHGSVHSENCIRCRAIAYASNFSGGATDEVRHTTTLDRARAMIDRWAIAVQNSGGRKGPVIIQHVYGWLGADLYDLLFRSKRTTNDTRRKGKVVHNTISDSAKIARSLTPSNSEEVAASDLVSERGGGHIDESDDRGSVDAGTDEETRRRRDLHEDEDTSPSTERHQGEVKSQNEVIPERTDSAEGDQTAAQFLFTTKGPLDTEDASTNPQTIAGLPVRHNARMEITPDAANMITNETEAGHIQQSQVVGGQPGQLDTSSDTINRPLPDSILPDRDNAAALLTLDGSRSQQDAGMEEGRADQAEACERSTTLRQIAGDCGRICGSSTNLPFRVQEFIAPGLGDIAHLAERISQDPRMERAMDTLLRLHRKH